MVEAIIELNTIPQVQRFVELASQRPGEVLVKSENYIVNGKSLLGMFSLDYTKLLRVVDTAGNYDWCNEFIIVVRG